MLINFSALKSSYLGRTFAAITFLMATLASPMLHSVEAQGVLGPGENATVLTKGLFELQILADWSSVYDRYSEKRGRYEPLGRNLNLDALGSSARSGRNTYLQIMRYNLEQLELGMK